MHPGESSLKIRFFLFTYLQFFFPLLFQTKCILILYDSDKIKHPIKKQQLPNICLDPASFYCQFHVGWCGKESEEGRVEVLEAGWKFPKGILETRNPGRKNA